MEKLLSECDEHGVLRLTLNDPARRNVLSVDMLDRLGGAVQDAAVDPAVKVIVIAANGPAFCAGHDLKEMTAARESADEGRAYYAALLTQCSEVMQAITLCRKPVIAEVQAVATAAGCQLVASCDLAIAADNARFCTPGVNIGTFCFTPSVAISRALSNKHAMELLLTGDMMSAQRASEIGLINRAVAPDDLRGAVTDLARRIASKSALAISTGKQAYHAHSAMALPQAYSYASDIMTERLLDDEAVEGVDAFFAKRAPLWRQG